MIRWRLPAAGVCLYALALTTSVPATLIDDALQGASSGRFRLAEARGTLWSGAGALEIRDAARNTGIGKRFAWNFLPASLMRGQLAWEITSEQESTRSVVTLSPSRIEIANADLSFPAAALALAVPKLSPLQPTGDVLVHIARLSIARARVDGDVSVRWQGAGSRLSQISPLGSYELECAGRGASISLTLHTLQAAAPLHLEGSGMWNLGAASGYSITARILPQHQQQLAPLLRLIAVESSDGSFMLQS